MESEYESVKSELIDADRHRPITARRIAHALRRLGADAEIGHFTAHQLRHTLAATQAINRGMSLDAIAALLGHKTLAMTMVYARIADKTVADEYFKVTEKVEEEYPTRHALYKLDLQRWSASLPHVPGRFGAGSTHALRVLE